LPTFTLSLGLAWVAAMPIAVAAAEGGTYEQLFADPAYLAKESGLSDSAKVAGASGSAATAGNARFHTYVVQQRLGVLIDWYRILNTDQRDERFSTWGSSTIRAAACPDRTTVRRRTGGHVRLRLVHRRR
jgi:hypothetical protein